MKFRYLELMECEIIETALEYIDKYPLHISDREMNKLLNKFYIRDRKVREADSKQIYNTCDYMQCNALKQDRKTPNVIGFRKLSFSLTYYEGITENQLELIKGILLSADYNFNRCKEMTPDIKKKNRNEIKNMTYQGKTLEDIEKFRLQAAGHIKHSKELLSKLNFIDTCGGYVYKGVEKIAENETVKKAAANALVISAARKMIEDGVSLSLITNSLKADLLIIYNLAESMNRPFKLSPEEEELVKKAQKEAENKKT